MPQTLDCLLQPARLTTCAVACAIVVVASPFRAFAQVGPDGVWVLLEPLLGRSSHSAVHDPLRQRMLVFGGRTNSSTPGTSRRNDCWVIPLAGSPVWQQLLPAGTLPSMRQNHTAIYDPVQDRQIVFGGFDGSRRNDVWELSLAGGSTVWNEMSPSGTPPSPRSSHTAVYDPVRHRMIIFGGIETDSNNEVWQLTLAGTPAWSLVVPAGTAPSARYAHAAVYDPVGDRMLVFGGNDGTYSNEVWELTLGQTPTWNLLAPLGPAPVGRASHSAIYDPDSHRMLIFAGTSTGAFDSDLDDVWELTLGDTPAWSELNPSGSVYPPRRSHTAIYDPTGQRMVIFGGRFHEFLPAVDLNQVHALSLGGEAVWSQIAIEGPLPLPRSQHSAVLDPARDRMLMFGGADQFQLFNDLWALDLGARQWVQLVPSGSPPSIRTEHRSVYDPLRDRMLVLAGQNGSAAFSDVWELSLAGTPTWSPLAPTGTPPAGRYAHTAIYDPLRDRVIMFGGINQYSSSVYNDVWELSLNGTPAWTRLTPSGTKPTPRFAHLAIYDPPRDRMVVCGGAAIGGVHFEELWELTLSGTPTWSLLGAGGTAPAAWQHSSAVYQSTRDHMVVFGGYFFDGGGHRVNTTWALDLSEPMTWMQLAPSGDLPMGRQDHSAIYDPARDQMVVFGGYGSNTGRLNDAPALLWTATVAVPHTPPSSETRPVRAYPVPLRDGATFEFDLRSEMHVSLALFDVAGRPVRRLIDERMSAGAQRARWDGMTAGGQPAAAGVYLYRLRIGLSLSTGRIIKLK